MSKPKQPDHFDWFGALQRSSEQARALRPVAKPTPDPCLCGSTDIRGRIIAAPVDLTADHLHVTCGVNEGQRPCAACQHGIAHGAMSVRLHHGPSTTVRDHFHPDCVRL